MFNLIHWGNSKIIETKVENYSDVCSRILNEFHLNQSKIENPIRLAVVGRINIWKLNMFQVLVAP